MIYIDLILTCKNTRSLPITQIYNDQAILPNWVYLELNCIAFRGLEGEEK